MRVAVLFDLDGTLIDSLPNIRDAANRVLDKRYLPPLELSAVAGFVGLGEDIFVDRLIAATDLSADERGWVRQEFLRHYREEAVHTRCFHGALKAVRALRDDSLPVGLVTNKPRGPLGPTLAAAGLAEVFDIVIAGDDLPRRKPDPLPLRHAIEALGVDRAIYVGDSETDAETAERAGIPFVLFTEGIRVAEVHDIPHEVAFNDFGMLHAICRRIAEA